MRNNLIPNIIYNDFNKIDFKALFLKGINALVIDIDNTLVADHISKPDERLKKKLLKLKEDGFNICLVSNSNMYRVKLFNEELEFCYIYKAWKPMPRAFKRAMKLLGSNISNTAMVGDQIFTDIYGGNKLGMYTVLTKPINKRENFFVVLKRLPERIVFLIFKNEIAKRFKK